MLRSAPARGDVVAGVSVALVLVPQSLAYATLAGLPPVHGLYAAAAAPILGALIGSSPYLQTGPVAVSSLLTFGALAGMAEPSTADFAALAAVLALVVGVIRGAVGLLGAGPIAYLMSQPVVVSFTSAAALLIISSQIPQVLGVRGEHDNPLLSALAALTDPGAWSWPAVGLGAGAVAVMLGARRISPLIPGALVVALGGVAFSRLTDYDGATVGDVDLDLHLLSGVPAGDVLGLLVPGLVIALVGFAEPAAIARKYAAEDRQPWDSNREFVGQGLANLAAGAVSGMPVGGSFSRSALNRLSGARTRWSGAITGLTVVALLPFTSLLAPLPTAVLGGLVISAVLSLVDYRAPVLYWRWSRPQFVVGVVTAVATLALAPHVERGVLLGVATALAVHLWRELNVTVPAEVVGDSLHLRPSGVLYFGSAPAVERAITTLMTEHPDLDRVVVHLEAVGRLDVTGALMLRDLAQEAEAGQRRVEITGARPPAARLLARVLELPGPPAPND